MKWIVVLLTLFSLYQGAPPPVSDCPRGWFAFPGDNRCYYISATLETFDRANEICTKANSELAPPLTCAQQVDLDEVLTAFRVNCRGNPNCNEFWIGIHKINSGDWQTTKGLEIEKSRQCQHWARRFPKEDYGNCVVMSYIESVRKKGAWKNANCTRKARYICITCPKGFDFLPDINECLKFIPIKEQWLDARMSCAKLGRGAQLMTIQSPEKQDAVTRYVNSTVLTSKQIEVCYFQWWTYGGTLLWMGGQTTDPKTCGTPYVWKPVAAPAIPLAYTNWHPGNPNCGHVNENCLMLMAINNRWNDMTCDSPLCYVCEF